MKTKLIELTNRTLEMKSIIKISLLIAMMGIVSATFAGRDDYSKNIKEEFPVNPDALLIIKNKYGEVHCQAWNKNVISIEVTITVEASSQEKAERTFDKIHVELSGNKSKVEGITTLSGSFRNVDFSIDYAIMIPKTVNIDFTNKFGDLFIDELDGISKILLEYGDMEIMALNNEKNDLILKFSDGEVGYMKQARLELSYSDFELQGSDLVNIESQFSDVQLGAMGETSVSSKYDDFTIEKTGNIECRARFSGLDIDRLEGDFNFDIQYGGLDVDLISSFLKGYVETSFASVELSFSEQLSFRLDAKLSFGDLSYPRNKSSIHHEEVGYTTNNYEGIIGSDEETSAMLTIRSKNAGVCLRYE